MVKAPKQRETAARAELRTLVQRHGADLASQLQAHHRNTFPPEAEKTIRQFSPAEASRLIGIHEGYLRQVAAEGNGIAPTIKNGRRSYSVDAIHEIRKHLDQGARGNRRYLPHRATGEHLQVITVMNFKGGSGKTTTSAHLAQYLALHGYRVLQSTLIRRLAYRPCLDFSPNFMSAKTKPCMGPSDTMNGGDRSRRLCAAPIFLTCILFLEISNSWNSSTTRRGRSCRGRLATLYSLRVSVRRSHKRKTSMMSYVIDCPPQLGYLTLSALTAATAVLITVHPQMLDVMSMAQFLQMTGDLSG